MLKEVWESDESQYPVASSNPSNSSSDGHGKSSGCHNKKNQAHYDKWGPRGYAVQATNVWQDLEEYVSDSLLDMESDPKVPDVIQDRSYHVGVTNMADKVEDFFGKCFNCGEEGHLWQDCMKPLKPSLKAALNAENDRQGYLLDRKQLNQTRVPRVKRGCIPKAGMAKAPLAPAKN